MADTEDVRTFDEYRRRYFPEQYERDRLAAMTPAEAVRDALAKAAARLVACRHCGKYPEADGDHSCPCPHTDAECPDHPVVTPSRADRQPPNSSSDAKGGSASDAGG